MPLIDDLDIGASPEADEQKMAMAGSVPEGKYHAALIGASDDTAGEFEVVRLEFQILSKPYAGKKIFDDVFLTGTDAEKTEKARQRKRMYCHRLGLLLKTPDPNDPKKHVYKLAPNKYHLRDCLGVECIIDVKLEPYDYTNRQGKHVKGIGNKLAYEGVFELSDPKVKDVPRGQSLTTKPAAAAENFDDI